MGEQTDWTDLVEALGKRELAVPASSFNARAPDARQPGVYAWWADDTARRLIAETLGTDGDPLIYIGKTAQPLGTRVRTHLNGTIRNSTFRWSLTAILMTTPEFAATHTDPCEVRGSRRLSAWMREHLEVAIVAVACPELVERQLIARYDPPLNGTRRGRLTELRAPLKAAREMKGCPPPGSQA